MACMLETLDIGYNLLAEFIRKLYNLIDVKTIPQRVFNLSSKD